MRIRIWLVATAVALALACPAAAVHAAELFMFRREGCPWCLAFDRAIAPIYANSDLGRRAPLRHVDVNRDPRPDVELAYPVRYTPTFVLVSERREVGRIEGYPGEDFFWGLLDNAVRKLPGGS